MNTLILKLIATPLLIAIASLIGRRWGPAVSGWLIGLPFTSAPIIFFLALDHGIPFAAAASVGVLVGTISQAAFSLAYAWLALRWPWPYALTGSCLAFAAATLLLQHLVVPLPLLIFLILLSIALTLLLLPHNVSSNAAATTPRRDLSVRMVVATAFVVALTAIAPLLGARLSGLLTPFPLYAAILSVFAHRSQGAAAVLAILRGLQFGLFAFVTFFLLLAVLLARIGIAGTFAVSAACTLLVQGLALASLRFLARKAETQRQTVEHTSDAHATRW
ncbi:MAG: hypothetical protein IMW89_19175 [Ktedonobacteraceae bacterium]|nr:hypothetical protein [Ktedonobacteraceae bacterium]